MFAFIAFILLARALVAYGRGVLEATLTPIDIPASPAPTPPPSPPSSPEPEVQTPLPSPLARAPTPPPPSPITPPDFTPDVADHMASGPGMVRNVNLPGETACPTRQGAPLTRTPSAERVLTPPGPNGIKPLLLAGAARQRTYMRPLLLAPKAVPAQKMFSATGRLNMAKMASKITQGLLFGKASKTADPRAALDMNDEWFFEPVPTANAIGRDGRDGRVGRAGFYGDSGSDSDC